MERKANRFERYAARFAAKEAGMKAIGTGWRRGVTWQDFEVANLPSGKPTLRLHGVAARIRGKAGRAPHLALAHPHGRAGNGARDSGRLEPDVLRAEPQGGLAAFERTLVRAIFNLHARRPVVTRGA